MKRTKGKTTMDETMLCPKSRDIVDCEKCVALRNMSKIMAEHFAIRVCRTVSGCPKEDYCSVFECGWTSVNTFLQSSMKD